MYLGLSIKQGEDISKIVPQHLQEQFNNMKDTYFVAQPETEVSNGRTPGNFHFKN